MPPKFMFKCQQDDRPKRIREKRGLAKSKRAFQFPILKCIPDVTRKILSRLPEKDLVELGKSDDSNWNSDLSHRVLKLLVNRIDDESKSIGELDCKNPSPFDWLIRNEKFTGPWIPVADAFPGRRTSIFLDFRQLFDQISARKLKVIKEEINVEHFKVLGVFFSSESVRWSAAAANDIVETFSPIFVSIQCTKELRPMSYSFVTDKIQELALISPTHAMQDYLKFNGSRLFIFNPENLTTVLFPYVQELLTSTRENFILHVVWEKAMWIGLGQKFIKYFKSIFEIRDDIEIYFQGNALPFTLFIEERENKKTKCRQLIFSICSKPFVVDHSSLLLSKLCNMPKYCDEV